MKKKSAKRLRLFRGGLTVMYIGRGKGKTTAAIGAAVRARGYGKRVLFFQFFKSLDWPSGERTSLQKLGVHVVVAGKGFVGILGDTKPKGEHRKAARAALRQAKKSIISKKYNVIVFDECISAVEVGLLSQSDIVSLIHTQKKMRTNTQPHLVLTGHLKYPTIVKHCDVVTDMRMVKHPYYKGYLAVKGIDF